MSFQMLVWLHVVVMQEWPVHGKCSVKLQFHEPSLPFGPTIETGLKNMKSILYGLSENEKHAKQ